MTFLSALNFAPGGGDPDRERVPDAPQGQPLQGRAGQGQEAVRPTDIGYVQKSLEFKQGKNSFNYPGFNAEHSYL